MGIDIQFLKAGHGDAIYISYNQEDGVKKNILIDTGLPKTYMNIEHRRPNYGELKTEVIDKLEETEKIDLLIITHWDNDHIGGLWKWFEEDKETAVSKIGDIWFNGGLLINEYFDTNYENSNKHELNIYTSSYTSTGQGISFEDIISTEGLWNKKLIKAMQTHDDTNIKFTILSPNDEKLKKLLTEWERSSDNPYTSGTENDYNKSIDELIGLIKEQSKLENTKFDKNGFKEDETLHNGSSIAFILEIFDKKMLFLGDSHPSVISQSLIDLTYSKNNPLKVDFVKISHHGSRGNTSDELLDLIDCNHFVILADGNHKGLPHKETLVRIIRKRRGCCFYFNYPELIEDIFEEELSDKRFELKSLEDLKI